MSLQHPINVLQKMSSDDKKQGPSMVKLSRSSSLANACRLVIANDLERYPPEAFGILDESEWESIIKLRHTKTRPLTGTGGIDGSGRMVPAVGYKIMIQIEDAFPHLAESHLVDLLVWKDCVEHKFKAGGVSRPPELMFPWPYLVHRLQDFGRILTSRVKEKQGQFDRDFWVAVKQLEDAPMNVPLLNSSKIGVVVKKFLKNFVKLCPDGLTDGKSPTPALDQTLQRWMKIAKHSGVEIDDGARKNPAAHAVSPRQQQIEKGLGMVQKCTSWRQLFASLHSYEEEQKSNQGARMRERRKLLDQNRRQIVKVRPSRASRHVKGRFGGGPAIPTKTGTNKMQQLKMESKVTSARRQPPGPMSKPTPPMMVSKGGSAPGGGFAAAVAFASVSRKSKKRAGKPTVVALSNGKRMRIPDGKTSTQHTSALKKRLGMLKRGPR
mmetsp:Transcript_13694/g.39104  ORF Transcript_13694/g.39104 Transcript_13694/m.39104 type:complete len:437 (-) Transcript_13694:192-1502(-)